MGFMGLGVVYLCIGQATGDFGRGYQSLEKVIKAFKEVYEAFDVLMMLNSPLKTLGSPIHGVDGLETIFKDLY